MTTAEHELDAAYLNLSRALAVYRDAQARFERAMAAVSDQGLESALNASARRLADAESDDRDPAGGEVAG